MPQVIKRSKEYQKNEIFFLGNIIADSLLYNKHKAEKSKILENLRLITK